MDGSADLSRIFGPEVSPANVAYAESACANCQTFAVALQIVLYRQGAPTVSPQNIARAINTDCTRCITIARAIQYVIPVENPREVPGNVSRLVNRMDRELNEIRRDRTITPAEANRRINAVVAEFRELGTYLRDQTDESTESTSPGATPGATGSPAAGTAPARSPSPTSGSPAAIAPAASPVTIVPATSPVAGTATIRP